MKIIQDLGKKPTGYIDKKTGKEQNATFALFECPSCGKQYELKVSRGLRQSTCKDCRSTQNATHGLSHTKLYHVWQSMRARCSNPNNKKYHIYGGKGITVCEQWKTFEGFYADMKEGYTEGESTIDRIDSSKGYNPENCRWVSHSRNSAETTKRRPVTCFLVIKKPEYRLMEHIKYESARKAAKELGLVAAHITATCQGKRKTHGGFAWQYT